MGCLLGFAEHDLTLFLKKIEELKVGQLLVCFTFEISNQSLFGARCGKILPQLVGNAAETNLAENFGIRDLNLGLSRLLLHLIFCYANGYGV